MKYPVEIRETARQAEVVLFFGGASTTEGADREDIDLPEVQKQVLKEVAAVNANVVQVYVQDEGRKSR